MRIFALKLNGAGYDITALRDDNVLVEVYKSDTKTGLPHELFHYGAEGVLNLSSGFWECVARGALFDGMQVLSADDASSCRERSDQLRQELGDEIGDAEFLVSAVSVTLDARLEGDVEAAEAEIRRCWPNLEVPSLQGIDMLTVREAVDRVTGTWDSLAPGDRMVLDWPMPQAS